MMHPGRNRIRAVFAGALVLCSTATAFSQSPINPFAPAAALSFFYRMMALSVSVPAPAPPQIAPDTPPQTAPPETAASSPIDTSSAKLVIKADYKERLDDKLTASGNVEIRYGEIILYADQVVFDEKTKDALAVGHVSLIRPNEAFTADRFALNLDTGLGKAENVIGLVQPQYRYESAEVERKSPDLFSLGKSTITGCSQPVPRWEFSVSRADFVRDEYIMMWNPVLRIKDVPVLYLPYLKYPLHQDRATGFLFPRIGYSGRKGFTLSQQFYWAIARNMDATFSLDYYAAKGVGAGIEYRYVFAGGMGGQLNAYYFVYRAPAAGVKPDNAFILRWKHNQELPGEIDFVANVDYQNSFTFSREFDNNFARALSYNRSSQVYLTKSWGASNLSLRVSRFETTYPAWTYARIRQSLPQINYSLFKKKLLGPTFFSMSAGYNNWQYGYSTQFEKGTQVKSSVLYLSPEISLPFNEIPWLGFDLSVSGNLNYYGNSRDPVSRKVVDQGFLSGNGSFSATMIGPIFYRVFDFNDSTTRLKHIIEPTITYRYDTPTVDSDRIVTTSGYFFHYHYLEYGLQNQILVKSGDDRPREVLAWEIAQTFYFDPKNSPLSRYKLEDGSIPRFSEITNKLRFFPVTAVSLDVSLGYNTYKKSLSSVRASAGLGDSSDKAHISVSWYKSINPYYGFTSTSRHQIGLSGGAKIPWLQLEALGEFEYNLAAKKVLYTGLAAVWHYQCIDVKMNVRAFFFRGTPEVQFQMSLGLGNIGSTSEFLGGRDL
ncbi:MAG: LPS assembly protein LptD [Candidatus Aminicenantes bacterium]|nr:LPS assembly protein LptD [Candidatus Aminicenantes bacterium]